MLLFQRTRVTSGMNPENFHMFSATEQQQYFNITSWSPSGGPARRCSVLDIHLGIPAFKSLGGTTGLIQPVTVCARR